MSTQLEDPMILFVSPGRPIPDATLLVLNLLVNSHLLRSSFKFQDRSGQIRQALTVQFKRDGSLKSRSALPGQRFITSFPLAAS
jgi:hypothetical protein